MKALSLFSGIGGIDLACEWAGIETVAFCEREPFPQKVLKKHWPSVPIYDDVCTLTKARLEADGIGTIDIIHGGYPCQPFSAAGKREGTNDDRHLWPEVFRLIQALQPRWFVGENVAGHITLGLDVVLSDLESIGYSWETFVLPACGVYALHRRERVFIVAHSPSAGLQIGRQSKVSTYEAEARARLEHQLKRCSEDVANPNSFTGLEAGSKVSPIGSKRESRNDARWSSGEYKPGVDWWSVEPDVGRVATRVPNRVDRLKALGNAVVPQQIYPVLAAIKQIDDMLKESSA